MGVLTPSPFSCDIHKLCPNGGLKPFKGDIRKSFF